MANINAIDIYELSQVKANLFSEVAKTDYIVVVHAYVLRIYCFMFQLPICRLCTRQLLELCTMSRRHLDFFHKRIKLR